MPAFYGVPSIASTNPHEWNGRQDMARGIAERQGPADPDMVDEVADLVETGTRAVHGGYLVTAARLRQLAAQMRETAEPTVVTDGDAMRSFFIARADRGEGLSPAETRMLALAYYDVGSASNAASEDLLCLARAERDRDATRAAVLSNALQALAVDVADAGYHGRREPIVFQFVPAGDTADTDALGVEQGMELALQLAQEAAE